MPSNPQLFNKLLEQYAFRVANLCIDAVDQPTQSELINFIKRIDATTPDEAVVNTSDLEPQDQVASQWKEILNEPVNWRSVHNQWLLDVTHQRAKRHELYITYLEETVRTAEQRLNQAQLMQSSQHSRSNLLHWYKQSLANYRHYLLKAQRAHQASLQQLQGLQKL